MSIPAATSPHYADGDSAMGRLRTDREHLTHVLRAMAAELDNVERRLSELDWRPLPGTRRGLIEAPGERTALAAQRERLSTRLQGLARRLKDIDAMLSAFQGHEQWPPAHVGSCPDCGYPTLGSGLCASCRLFLVR